MCREIAGHHAMNCYISWVKRLMLCWSNNIGFGAIYRICVIKLPQNIPSGTNDAIILLILNCWT